MTDREQVADFTARDMARWLEEKADLGEDDHWHTEDCPTCARYERAAALLREQEREPDAWMSRSDVGWLRAGGIFHDGEVTGAAILGNRPHPDRGTVPVYIGTPAGEGQG